MKYVLCQVVEVAGPETMSLEAHHLFYVTKDSLPFFSKSQSIGLSKLNFQIKISSILSEKDQLKKLVGLEELSMIRHFQCDRKTKFHFREHSRVFPYTQGCAFRSMWFSSCLHCPVQALQFMLYDHLFHQKALYLFK